MFKSKQRESVELGMALGSMWGSFPLPNHPTGQTSCQDRLKPMGSTDELEEEGGGLQLGHSSTQHWEEEAGSLPQGLGRILPLPTLASSQLPFVVNAGT